MKRLVALLCAMLMLTSAIACGKAEPADTTVATTTAAPDATTAATEATTPAETEPPKAFDTVPAQNLGGDFHILYSTTDQSLADFEAETQNGDIKNDLIFARNTMVEEKLGIDVKLSPMGYTDLNAECQRQVQAGGDDYDMFGGHRNSLVLSYQGFHYNLLDIDTLNLDQEWWDQNYVDAITINDALYTVIGDIGVSTLLFVSSLTFNKKLMDEQNMAYPYDLVREGKWTMDALLTMTADYGTDLNGDGILTRDNDRLAMVGWSTESGYSLFYGSGFAFINRDAMGDPVLEYDSDKLVNVLEKTLEIWLRDNVFIFTDATSGTEHQKTYGVFGEGRALFSDIVLSKIGTFYTSMEDDYGILPCPKYSEDQTNYSAYLGYTIPILFLPSNVPDPERNGTIMEALCTASYDNVTPQMYEIVTKLKNVRDEDSSEMIEIIIRNKVIDTAHFYNVQGYGTIPRDVIVNKTGNIASTLKSYERVAVKQWEKILDNFDKLG
ncbi:MAG: extracellular solute-binding protein [Clostridia bacterium]|nr:extracellular solute-binding protein [Clostridia bacterium]